ncbi:hypothetical protein ACLOJK_010542 [Asimina triloba]
MGVVRSASKFSTIGYYRRSTLGRIETMTDDILHIFFTLDRRFSPFVSFDHVIWSEATASTVFLQTINELLATIGDWDPLASKKLIAAYLFHADKLL